MYSQNKNAVFTSIGKGDRVKGNAISDRDIDRLVKKYFGPEYSAHSMRAGFVTEVAKRGAKNAIIKNQTGHKTDQMIVHYTRLESVKEDNAVLLM